MKVYLIYDCYHYGESFQVYQVCKTKSEVEKVYKKELFDFVNYGPDDLHSFQCQLVEVTDEEYGLLMRALNNELECFAHASWDPDEEDEKKLYELMARIFDECIPYDSGNKKANCLFATDGYSDAEEVFNAYMEESHPDVEEDSDEWYDLQEEFYGDDDLFNKELLKYIDSNYQI